MSSFLSRRIEAGQGLGTQQGYIIFVNVDGTTLSIDGSGKVYLLPVDSQHIQDNAVTTTKISDNSISTPKLQDKSVTLGKLAIDLRYRYVDWYYTFTTDTPILPCFELFPRECLKTIYLVSKDCYVSSSDYWNISVYRWSEGDTDWTLLVGPVALTGTTYWNFAISINPNFTATIPTLIGFAFTAIGNPSDIGKCVIRAQIEKKE